MPLFDRYILEVYKTSWVYKKFKLVNVIKMAAIRDGHQDDDLYRSE